MIVLLDTDHGYISSRYVIKFVADNTGGWIVYYQMGAETLTASCSADSAKEFTDAISGTGR